MTCCARRSVDEWLLTKGRQPAAGTVSGLVRGLASCPLCKAVPIDIPLPTVPTMPDGPRSRVLGGARGSAAPRTRISSPRPNTAAAHRV